MAKGKLLIHHHMVAWQGDDGIYMQSFIGAWIQALSGYYEEIGILFKTSNERLPAQDFKVFAPNVKLIPIQTQGLGYFKKRQEIRELCHSVSSNYDTLIIRGITPLQKIIFDSCKVKNKFFLLVGSPSSSKPRFRFNRIDIIVYILYWVRLMQFKKIAAKGKVLANSPMLINELSEEFGIQATFIPTNTISDSHFVSDSSIHLSEDLKCFKLMFCGRIVYDKGIAELFDAIEILTRKGLFPQLDLIGPVASDYKSYLDKKARDLGISDQINYLGYIGFGEELLMNYRKADLFVLPTWHEGFPHAIWEAACSNTPVIVTPVGGIPGLVSENEVFFIEVKNAKSIADKIIYAIENKEATLQKVKNAHQLAKSFTVEKCAEKLVNFIDSI